MELDISANLVLLFSVMQLLEGLQSSLIASKITGEKVPRTNFRSATSASRGNSSLFVVSGASFIGVISDPVFVNPFREPCGNRKSPWLIQGIETLFWRDNHGVFVHIGSLPSMEAKGDRI